MNSQSGFTLIEALATGLISTIVAGAILSLLHMSNAQINDGTINLRLARLQGVASDQIRSSTRIAAGVKTAAEDTITDFDHMPVMTAVSSPLKEVRLCQQNGLPFARYRIVDGTPQDYLEEWKETPVKGYHPFMVGGDTVFVDYANSFFRILPDRRGITFAVQHTRAEDGKSYTFPRIEEVALIRNL
jgi:type II secretory pathway pseudopilin PulG